MKRHNSTDSLGALMSICPTTGEETHGNNQVYTREFGSGLDGLDEEGCVEELGSKKRRLSVDQVKALEKNFEVENKLEPERKVKLAQELGLQPRQVAVWFQNRRARWKTKQLERDYGVLKANYDSLKQNFESLQHDNESLLNEIRELKSKLHEEKKETSLKVKEEEIASDNNDKVIGAVESLAQCDESIEMNLASFANDEDGIAPAVSIFFPDLKDGSSDSEYSSAILNEDNNSSPNAAISSGVFGHLPNNCFQFSSDSKTILGDDQKAYQPQFVKIEEHNFFSGDDTCNFFSDDQAPSLQWYCHDQWNSIQ